MINANFSKLKKEGESSFDHSLCQVCATSTVNPWDSYKLVLCSYYCSVPLDY